MEKQLLTVEFRYNDAPKSEGRSEYRSKTITIGIYDTLKEAVEAGNETLKKLSENFELRQGDNFSVNGGCFGTAQKLVTNTCYPTNGVQYFAKIDTLKFDSLSETITESFKASKRYKAYQLTEL